MIEEIRNTVWLLFFFFFFSYFFFFAYVVSFVFERTNKGKTDTKNIQYIVSLWDLSMRCNVMKSIWREKPIYILCK